MGNCKLSPQMWIPDDGDESCLCRLVIEDSSAGVASYGGGGLVSSLFGAMDKSGLIFDWSSVVG